jgi:hypothetical protein
MQGKIFALFLSVLLVAGLAACSDGGNNRKCKGTETPTDRLFLQQLSDTSVVIKWQGEATAACIGTLQDSLKKYSEATVTEGGHKEVMFTDLKPGVTYFYSIGAARVAPDDQFFTTSPEVGQLPADANTRIWIIGDSGTGGDDERPDHEGEALEVLAGMEKFVARDGEAVDVFLMLGDNAYAVGSDFNFQQAVFETYPALLKTLSLWPTIGNHEMGLGFLNATVALAGFSQSADPGSWIEDTDAQPSNMPYLDIFSLPTGGEAGGVPSGTEQYYSFDYGNVHFVSLDSQLSARDPDQLAAMKSWLIEDLSSNDSDWTIVIFHHPPYSKGANHDSDDTEKLGGFDMPQQWMREQFVPVFDQYGVDVVYNGHSHSYERSYYLTNLIGKSDTYSAANNAELVDGNPNRPASGRLDEHYQQLSPTSGGVDDRVVYTVTGNGGKADSSSGLTAPDQWLLPPAMIAQPADTVSPRRRGLAVIGSVVVDAGPESLHAQFIDANGETLDSFRITR